MHIPLQCLGAEVSTSVDYFICLVQCIIGSMVTLRQFLVTLGENSERMSQYNGGHLVEPTLAIPNSAVRSINR